jgi:hypothetical protein
LAKFLKINACIECVTPCNLWRDQSIDPTREIHTNCPLCGYTHEKTKRDLKKTTCNKCKALLKSDDTYHCDLGHEIIVHKSEILLEDKAGLVYNNPIPKDICPKPITFIRLFEIKSKKT